MPGFHTKMRKAPERLCAYFLKRAKLKVLKPNCYRIKYKYGAYAPFLTTAQVQSEFKIKILSQNQVYCADGS